MEHPVPLLAAGLKRRDLRAGGEELRLACHEAVVASAGEAVRPAIDLARRSSRLKAVAPKLRAKGAGGHLRGCSGGHGAGQLHGSALFTALNKDTCELYHERVPFEPAAAQALSDKAVDVLRAVDAGDLLPRIATSPDFFLCRFCSFAARCWEDRA